MQSYHAGGTASSGMTDLNGNTYTITKIDANSFSLDDTDTTGYSPFDGTESTGVATRVGSVSVTVMASES